MKKVIDKYKLILILIIIFAILIRICFIYKTNISKFQSDMGIGSLNSEEDYDNLYHNFVLYDWIAKVFLLFLHRYFQASFLVQAV